MASKNTSSNSRQAVQRSNSDSARWIAGLLLLFIGLFAAAAVFFSFFSWAADQSGLQKSVEERVTLGIEPENLCGWAGARLGMLLVDHSFGLFGILIPAMIVLVGVRIVRQRPLLFNHSILSLFLIMILGSLTLGFAFADRWSLCCSTGWGGAFGIALVQGVKRGLMSNEAGQGTITMPAAASDAKHPCDQGCVQALGVFLDTIVICTLTGFVVIMGRVWLTDAADAWFKLDKLPKFLASCAELTPGTALNGAVTFLVTLCFGLFAFTCLVGFLSFSEICANRISRSRAWITIVHLLCLVVIAFGVVTSIAGLDLGSLWNMSDFANIVIAYCNIPLLYIGFKYVKRATRHFDLGDGTPFTSDVIGIDVPLWDEKAKEEK